VAATARFGIVERRSSTSDAIYSGTVLGFFWSATMNTRIFVRLSELGLRDVEWTAVGGS
jgi:hypothetical protein